MSRRSPAAGIGDPDGSPGGTVAPGAAARGAAARGAAAHGAPDHAPDHGAAAHDAPAAHDEATGIRIRLDELLVHREMTLTELSERVGITIVNLSILKNGHARAVRFSTLARLCAVLNCQPGDLLAYDPAGEAADDGGR